jgi:hypothetical protein
MMTRVPAREAGGYCFDLGSDTLEFRCRAAQEVVNLSRQGHPKPSVTALHLIVQQRQQHAEEDRDQHQGRHGDDGRESECKPEAKRSSASRRGS